MSNIGVYVLDNSAFEQSVLATFRRHELLTIDPLLSDGKQKIFVDANINEACGKVIGCATKYKVPVTPNVSEALLKREIEYLQSIAALLAKPNYDKLYLKFSNERVELQKDINAARDSVARKGMGSEYANYSMRDVGVFDMLKQHFDAIQNDKKVVKAQAALKKFIDSNQLMVDAQDYSLGGQGGDMARQVLQQNASISLISTLVEQGNDINQVIEDAKAGKQSPLGNAFIQFKSMITELLAQSKSVGCMIVSDNETNYKNVKENFVSIKELKIDNVAFLKNREMLTITKF